LKFYTVTEEYLTFLQKHEKKVPNPKGASYKNAKPFVGIVLEVEGHKFLAPLTSYKPELHNKLPKSFPTHCKIHEIGNPENQLGLVALRFMIPVLDSEITELDFSVQQEPYLSMLQRQYASIKENQEVIKKQANKLYSLVVNDNHSHFVELACDFALLVSVYQEFTE
jgi:protein AbiQ